jgi:membrane protease YdiL (CAAX protease family)
VNKLVEPENTIKSVVRFYVLAYVISWAIWSPLVFFPQQSERLGVLVLVGAFGPLLAAAIAAWIEGGWAECKGWLKTAFRWRIHVGWYLLGGLGLPLGTAALHVGLGALLGGQVRTPDDPAWPWTALLYPVSVLVNAVISSAGGEEPGWRGFALPRLVQRMHPLAASALMGALWGPWHGPLFFTTQWQGREQAWLLFLYCIPLSIIANWLTFRAKQSAIPAMLLHAGGNGYGALFAIEGAALGSWALGFTELKTVVYWVVALVLVAATRGRLGCPARGHED